MSGTKREGVLINDDGSINVTFASGSTVDSPTFTGQIKGVPYNLLRSTIPLIVVSSGTMGNNGALSAITALAFTYPDCYLYLPAGAIATGVPAAADWYYAQMSSTTAGTVFNNTLSANVNAAGEPTIPSSTTAFVTTGPGAFTGVTTAAVALTITIPANYLGARGGVEIEAELSANNSVGQKLYSALWSGSGGSSIGGASDAITTQTGMMVIKRLWNRGKTNAQLGTGILIPYNGGTGISNQAFTQHSVDTTAQQTISIEVSHATATDNVVLENLTARASLT